MRVAGSVVRVRVHEDLGDDGVATCTAHVHWRLQVGPTLHVHLGTRRDQQLRACEVAVHDGQHERRQLRMLRSAGRQSRAALVQQQQAAQVLSVAGLACLGQRRRFVAGAHKVTQGAPAGALRREEVGDGLVDLELGLVGRSHEHERTRRAHTPCLWPATSVPSVDPRSTRL